MTRAEFVRAWKHNPLSRHHCFYCGREFKKGEGSKRSSLRETMEHLVPQHSYKGGGPVYQNTVRACAGCNGAKNGDSMREFKEWFGRPFYSEFHLNQEFPIEDNSVFGDGTMRIYYGGMAETFGRRVQGIIDRHFENRKFKGRLKRIVREAQENARRGH